MHARSSFGRLASLSRADALLLGEATVCLAWARVKTGLLPFRKLMSTGQARTTIDSASASRIAWAVQAAARRMPFRAVCLQQGLAVMSMLQRRGIQAKLHFGVADTEERGLHAHVWVSSGDAILIGGAEAATFTPLHSSR